MQFTLVMPADPRPPTTRVIAKIAGISSTAVSMALREHPKISLETRRRVQEIAKKLGYRPDPDVSKLMHHLRSRHKKRFQSTLCAITTISEAQELNYLSKILSSAGTRADALGHALMVLRVEDVAKPRKDLQRMLRSRGVEGLLLCPMVRPREFPDLLDWSSFSVVAATNSFLSPEFHRIVPHQFSNMQVLCGQLVQRGYRRIGLVLHAAHDLSVNHSFSAAVMWQNMLGSTEHVMPLLCQGAELTNLRAWFESEKPDAIVVAGDVEAKVVARDLDISIPGPIGFASASKSGPSIFAGMEERPAEIGSTAIGLLASMIQRGERGIPLVPTVTMIKGLWVEGRSVRSAVRKTRAKLTAPSVAGR